ncbi:MAG TPA: pitrilysin family protein, partial [Bryobacteraceae bacterium]|nr:pitrilysin family protein [Bryobacteraceae bacterium]
MPLVSRTAVLLLLVTQVLSLLRAGVPSRLTRVTQVEGITEFRVSNGLRVLLFPDPTRTTFTVTVTYRVGSRHEGSGETGMAHLLEHLCGKTPRHPRPGQEIQSKGGRANAETSYDYTSYYETLPATAANLRWAIEFEGDRMANSLVDQRELDNERLVVGNELSRAENNPVNMLGDHMHAAVFEWHGYGHRTLGLATDVRRVSADRLRSFYRRYYRPDNAVLIVTGRFNESDVLAHVSREFTKIPRPSEAIEAMYTEEPVQEGERVVTLRRPTGFQRVQAVYRIPAGSHSDYAPLLVLAEIMRQTPRGRLHARLVAAGLADRVGSNAIQLADPGLITFGANARSGSDLEQLKRALLATVEGFAEMPPTQEEVTRARNALLRVTKRSLIDSADTASALSTAISMGDWRLF